MFFKDKAELEITSLFNFLLRRWRKKHESVKGFTCVIKFIQNLGTYV